MNTEYILRWVQIAFYITVGVIAVLAYLKAKKGLFNPVNKEYHKRMILKVEEISNYLHSEFDEESGLFYLKQKEVDYCVDLMISKYKEGELHEGETAVNPVTIRLENFLNKVKSEPFVPNPIRNIVVKHLEERLKMDFIFDEELRSFGESLIKDPEKYLNDKDIASSIHNKIIQKRHDLGWGGSNIEEKVNNIRLEIQRYYENSTF